MKICIISTGHHPLDDRIYYKEALSLAKKYSSIFIVAPGTEKDYTEEDDITFVPLKKSGSILQRLLNIPAAIKTILKIKPQICHFHDFELIFALPFVRLLTKSKIIYDVHEVYPDMAEESRKIPYIIRPLIVKLVDICERKLASLAHYVITTDEDIANRFRQNHRHVSVIFNYPRLSIFMPDEKRVDQLKKLYLGRTPIIYTGGMNESKGLFQMIRAMQIIKSTKPDVLLLLLGPIDDHLREQADREIDSMGLQSCVQFLGFVPHLDIVNYISISKVGLIANLPIKKWHKNIPIKQFEYMACGVPVLGSDLPPIASYVKVAGCGEVFDSTRVDALASGVNNILQSESGWNQMSEAGRKAVQDLWNWNKMEEKLFTVYENILNTH